MSPARWAQIKGIFAAALEKSGAEQSAFVDEACGSDAGLRRELERLLNERDASGLTSPAEGWLAAATRPGFAAGTAIGHYQVESKLGEGGMGMVYKAYDTRLRRSVALKIIAPEHVLDGEWRHRLIREARAAAALNHPNIVTVYEIGSEGGVDFIVMEYVDGQPLEALIGPKGLRAGEALDYALQMADALVQAHSAGVVHRDLKPANVLVTAGGRVKVLDFGLAKLTESALAVEDSARTDRQSTEAGMLLGTASYMSPEQVEGGSVDARSDIFSFGSVLYEMLCGRRAFKRNTPTLTMAAILYVEPPPLGAKAPYGLEKVVERCLRKDPASRFQTMAAVKTALEEIREEMDPVRPAPANTRRSKRRLLAGAALAGVLAAGIGVTLAIRAFSSSGRPGAASVFRLPTARGVVAPHLIRGFQPQYTYQARSAKLQGEVVLYAEIALDGRAGNVKVLRGLGKGLDERAVEAVKQWKFAPGRKNGKPAPMPLTLRVSFRL